MYRVSDMIGKPVVSTRSGDKLGTISDALLDASRVELVGLIVRHGLIPKEHVLPLGDVQTVGRDAVLAATEEHLLSSREWRERDEDAIRSSALRGRRVVTAAGEQVGTVSDFLVDEGTATLQGIEIESHSLAGLRSHRAVLSPRAAPRIGPDAVIVQEDGIVTDRDRDTHTDDRRDIRDSRGDEP